MLQDIDELHSNLAYYWRRFYKQSNLWWIVLLARAKGRGKPHSERSKLASAIYVNSWHYRAIRCVAITCRVNLPSEWAGGLSRRGEWACVMEWSSRVGRERSEEEGGCYAEWGGVVWGGRAGGGVGVGGGWGCEGCRRWRDAFIRRRGNGLGCRAFLGEVRGVWGAWVGRVRWSQIRKGASLQVVLVGWPERTSRCGVMVSKERYD